MFTTVVYTSVIILQNVLVNSRPSEIIKSGFGNVLNEAKNSDQVNDVYETTPMQFPKGIVLYSIDSSSYDDIITTRIQAAMDVIEASSCLVFKELDFIPSDERNGSWVYFTNPNGARDCVHEPVMGDNGEIVIVLGFDCMTSRNLLHAVLHALGFKDEVSHPHRDQYIRIMWENIQPAYRDLFRMQQEDAPYKVVEYDPMSIMHFHDRAFSINGGPTIAPRVPGLLIAPSDKLSQLDIMKLRVWFGHECNKRKVGALLEKCKNVFHNRPQLLSGLASAMPDDSLNYEDPDEDKRFDWVDDDDERFLSRGMTDSMNDHDDGNINVSDEGMYEVDEGMHEDGGGRYDNEGYMGDGQGGMDEGDGGMAGREEDMGDVDVGVDGGDTGMDEGEEDVGYSDGGMGGGGTGMYEAEGDMGYGDEGMNRGDGSMDEGDGDMDEGDGDMDDGDEGMNRGDGDMGDGDRETDGGDGDMGDGDEGTYGGDGGDKRV